MKITRYWIPVFLGFSIIFYLSSLPQNQLPKIEILYFDKLVHFCMYSGLGLLVARALTSPLREEISWILYRRSILKAILIVTLYGALDEWHQYYSPGRGVEWLDFVADGLGAIAGAFFVIPYRRWILDLSRPSGKNGASGKV